MAENNNKLQTVGTIVTIGSALVGVAATVINTISSLKANKEVIETQRAIRERADEIIEQMVAEEIARLNNQN